MVLRFPIPQSLASRAAAPRSTVLVALGDPATRIAVTGALAERGEAVPRPHIGATAVFRWPFELDDLVTIA